MGVLLGSIALTGGPCAGKTTTITRIEEHLKELGYHVLVLNECATETINSGVRPFGNGAISVYDFENEILKLQLFKEKRFKEVVKYIDNKCILLCDRGAIDVKAYLGQELFDKLALENNVKEEDLLNEYDLVIHMVSVATDTKNRYGNTNNSARFEDADEAISLDYRTSEAWKKHSNLKVIPVTDVLETKIQMVLNEVDELLKKID